MQTDPFPATLCRILIIVITSDVIKSFDCLYILLYLMHFIDSARIEE